MYPPETSLIPATIALSRFVEINGLSSMFGNYPFWYLGSTPFRFLTGPLVPLTLTLIHNFFKDVSLFDITIWIIVVTYVISAIGWGILVGKIQNPNFKFLIFGIGHLAFIILLVLPWRLFSALTLSEASLTIAKNVLPFVLLAFWKFYKEKDRKSAFLSVMLTSLLLLINTSVFSILLVGLVSLILAGGFKKGNIRGISGNIKGSLILLIGSVVLVTLWYTPGYWITVLLNPSIGGASGIKVIIRIIDLLKTTVPLILAIIVVYFSGKIKNRLTVFILIWILTFGFLTLFRFIGDPDFWMDWTAWLSELEVGIALLISIILNNFWRARKSQIPNPKFLTSYFLLSIVFLLPFYLTWRFHLVLGRPKLINRDIPQGVQSLEKLNEIVNKDEAGLPFRSLVRRRVFLSGSTVFWANALYDIYQLRGGRDQVAVHEDWDKAAYELREGNNPEASSRWLHELDISYALVHGPKSGEYYHDFKNINKWKDIGKIVWEADGDIIYEVSSREQE